MFKFIQDLDDKTIKDMLVLLTHVHVDNMANMTVAQLYMQLYNQQLIREIEFTGEVAHLEPGALDA